jgi:hypothetical protein
MTTPVLVVPSGSGTLILSYSQGAISVVGTGLSSPLPAIVFVPANATTGLSSGTVTAFNFKGDPYVATSDMELSFEVVSARVSCFAKNLTLSLAAPTVVSAQIVTGHTDQLAVTFNKPVYLPDAFAFSTAYTSGTPRTVTGIVSNNGSSTVVLQLSGTTMNTDAFSLVVSVPNRVTDLVPGNGLVASTTSVNTTPGAGPSASSIVQSVDVGTLMPLLLTSQLLQLQDIGTTHLDFSFAMSGHIPGSQTIIEIPKNQRPDTTTVPDNPPQLGAQIDRTLDQSYVCTVMQNGAVETNVITVTKDPAPTIVSSTYNGALLTTVFSARVTSLTPIAGLSLADGIAILSLASGLGTTTLVHNLASGPGGSTSLVVSSACTIQSMGGTLLAPTTQPVTASGVPAGGLVADWDADHTTNNGTILTGDWVDQVGSRHAALTNTPGWAASQIGTHAGVTFAGSPQCVIFASAGVWRAQPFEVWMVVKPITWAAGHYMWGSNPGNPANLQQSGSTPEIDLYAGLGPNCSNTGATLGSWHIVRSLLNGASSLIQVDNGTATTGNPSTAGLDGFSIGAFMNGSGCSNIEVSRVLVYDTSSGSYPGAAAIYAALVALGY